MDPRECGDSVAGGGLIMSVRASTTAHRLVVLACSATKRQNDGYMPAIDRYDGPLWQTVRSIPLDRTVTKIAVLSALYGFIDSRSPIQNYDRRLTEDLADRMIAGGLTTRWPRPPSPRKPDNYGNHAGCEMALLTDHGDRPFSDVVIVGGYVYLRVMRSFVNAFRDRGYLAPGAAVDEINAPIGLMRKQLRIWLERP